MREKRAASNALRPVMTAPGHGGGGAIFHPPPFSFHKRLLLRSAEVDAMARQMRVRLFRTSAKECVNVGGVFQHLAEAYVARTQPVLEQQPLSLQPDFGRQRQVWGWGWGCYRPRCLSP